MPAPTPTSPMPDAAPGLSRPAQDLDPDPLRDNDPWVPGQPAGSNAQPAAPPRGREEQGRGAERRAQSMPATERRTGAQEPDVDLKELREFQHADPNARIKQKTTRQGTTETFSIGTPTKQFSDLNKFPINPTTHPPHKVGESHSMMEMMALNIVIIALQKSKQ